MCQVNISVIGVEVKHAGQVFDGGESDISQLLIDNGFEHRGYAGHDSLFVQKKMQP